MFLLNVVFWSDVFCISDTLYNRFVLLIRYFLYRDELFFN